VGGVNVAAGKSYRTEDHQLTAELVRKHTKNNLVMVTWANNHYYDFVKNWVYNLNKIGVSDTPTAMKKLRTGLLGFSGGSSLTRPMPFPGL
jgi:hypothetical protein